MVKLVFELLLTKKTTGRNCKAYLPACRWTVSEKAVESIVHCTNVQHAVERQSEVKLN